LIFGSHDRRRSEGWLELQSLCISSFQF
jgi:hypothetical protein